MSMTYLELAAIFEPVSPHAIRLLKKCKTVKEVGEMTVWVSKMYQGYTDPDPSQIDAISVFDDMIKIASAYLKDEDEKKLIHVMEDEASEECIDGIITGHDSYGEDTAIDIAKVLADLDAAKDALSKAETELHVLRETLEKKIETVKALLEVVQMPDVEQSRIDELMTVSTEVSPCHQAVKDAEEEVRTKKVALDAANQVVQKMDVRKELHCDDISDAQKKAKEELAARIQAVADRAFPAVVSGLDAPTHPQVIPAPVPVSGSSGRWTKAVPVKAPQAVRPAGDTAPARPRVMEFDSDLFAPSM